MTELAQLIRRRRLELRLTQRQAAERAGLSLATWQNLERAASTPDGFQELTLARAAHSLRLGLPAVFDAAGRTLPEHDLPSWDQDPDSPGTDEFDGDPQDRIDHLTALLRALAQRSPNSFLIVYGQAAETAQHLLDLHERHDTDP